jgi:hypothetical protein
VSAFIEEHREVEPICRTLGDYERASGWRSPRQVEDERLLARIKEVHEANYCAYGYRRIWKALLRCGEEVGRDRVRRLMRQHNVQGAKRRGKPWRTTKPDPKATRPVISFSATSPRPSRTRSGSRTSRICAVGRSGVLQLRDRRIQPPDQRLAVRLAHAHHTRSRRTQATLP